MKQRNLDQWDSYMAVARTLVAQPLKTKGREVATAVDMSILLIVLEACTNDMNGDGSMPTARIRENWKILFANGDVERPWSPRRYAALRDQLSTLGYIDWQDARYLPAALNPDGKGKAARWRLTEVLMDMLESGQGGSPDSRAIVQEERETDCLELEFCSKGTKKVGQGGSCECMGLEVASECVTGFGHTGKWEKEEDLYCDRRHEELMAINVVEFEDGVDGKREKEEDLYCDRHPEEAISVNVCKFGAGVYGNREREEDLYCDTIEFLPLDAMEPTWLTKLRQCDIVRPLLDVGLGRFRMAA